MTRVLGMALAVALGTAPYQCGREHESAELAHEDSPDDALLGVADRLHAQRDLAGEREALKYLVERFPRGRRASEARARLGQEADAGDIDAAR